MRELTLLADGKPVKLHELTKDEVREIYQLYKNAHDVLSRMETVKYYPGMKAKFMARGSMREGIITKVNQKSISIKTDIGVWRVSPSLIID